MFWIANRLYPRRPRAALHGYERHFAQRPPRRVVFGRRLLRQRPFVGFLSIRYAGILQADTAHDFQRRRRDRALAENRTHARYPESAQRSLLRNASQRPRESFWGGPRARYGRQVPALTKDSAQSLGDYGPSQRCTTSITEESSLPAAQASSGAPSFGPSTGAAWRISWSSIAWTPRRSGGTWSLCASPIASTPTISPPGRPRTARSARSRRSFTSARAPRRRSAIPDISCATTTNTPRTWRIGPSSTRHGSSTRRRRPPTAASKPNFPMNATCTRCDRSMRTVTRSTFSISTRAERGCPSASAG